MSSSVQDNQPSPDAQDEPDSTLSDRQNLGVHTFSTVLVLTFLGQLAGSLPRIDLSSLLIDSIFHGAFYAFAVAAVLAAFGCRDRFPSMLVVPPAAVGAAAPLLGHWQIPVWPVQWSLAAVLTLFVLPRSPVRSMGSALSIALIGLGSWWTLGRLDSSEGPALLFLATCGAGLLLLRLVSRAHFAQAMRNLRWERVLHYVSMFSLGVYMSAPKSFSLALVLAGALCVVLFWSWAVVNNDICDRKIDEVSNPDRPIVAGVWTPSQYAQFGNVQVLLLAGGAFIIGPAFTALMAALLAIAFVYSNPPARLKKYLVISTGLIAMASLGAVLSGFICLQEREVASFPAPIAVFMLVALTFGVNFKDIKDYEGDRLDGVHTLVTWLGPRWGKLATAISFVVALLSAPLILSRMDLLPAAILFAALGAFVMMQRHYREKLIFLIYYLYFVVLLASGVFRA